MFYWAKTFFPLTNVTTGTSVQILLSLLLTILNLYFLRFFLEGGKIFTKYLRYLVKKGLYALFTEPTRNVIVNNILSYVSD
jgi:hypothetical protein